MIDVSGLRYGLDRGETLSVSGTLITLEVPFTGDPEMFKVGPSDTKGDSDRAGLRCSTVGRQIEDRTAQVRTMNFA